MVGFPTGECPLIIKHGLLKNTPFTYDLPVKNPLKLGYFIVTFDYQRLVVDISPAYFDHITLIIYIYIYKSWMISVRYNVFICIPLKLVGYSLMDIT